MPFEDNSVFCCLALHDGPRLTEDCIDGGNGVSVRNSPPVQLDNAWTQWLGSIQARQFHESKFIIVAHEKLGPYAGDEYSAMNAVEQRAQLVHYCLLLSGIGYTGEMLKVCGNTRSSHLHVGPIGNLPPHPRPGYRRVPKPDKQHIKDAVLLAANAGGVYPKSYADRVRRGFRAVILGWQSDIVDERLHSFIRAIEAITKPGRKGITKIFRERAQLFTGRSPANAQLLEELYNIRSCYEHTNDVLIATTKAKGVRQDHAVAFRSLQAELLASAVYRRIFENPRLIAQFSTLKGFDDFWADPEDKRQAQWGLIIDLDRETRKVFFGTE